MGSRMMLTDWWELFHCSCLFRISFGFSKVSEHLDNFTLVYACYTNVFFYRSSPIQIGVVGFCLALVGVFVQLKLRDRSTAFLIPAKCKINNLQVFLGLFASSNSKSREMKKFLPCQIFTSPGVLQISYEHF